MQALFERTTTPMVLVDDERRYRDCNPAACDVLATSREALLTMRLDERVPAETLPGLDERWQRFLKLDAHSGASSLVTADGAVVYVHQSSTPNVLPGLHLLVFVPDGDDTALDEIIEEAGEDIGDKTQALTPREREVMTMLALGDTGAEIAEKLFISPETVRIHVRNARRRLGARTRAQAIALALRDGEIELGSLDGSSTPNG
jgi:PAS domain S-box-containing protein